MPLTAFIARSAASRSAILRSIGTANGSSSTGVSNRPWAGGRSSRTTGVRMAVALARAIRTASAATRSASAVSRRWLAAKPHAPPTITRTPKPSLSPPATPSTRPDLTLIDSSSRRTTRTSAYVAPRAVAVSRARLVRSRIGRRVPCRARRCARWMAVSIANGWRRSDAGAPRAACVSRAARRPGLGREHDADREHDDRGAERDEPAGRREGEARAGSVEGAAGQHDGEADPGHHGRHPEAERRRRGRRPTRAGRRRSCRGG